MKRHGRSCTTPSLMPFEILCAKRLLPSKSCLSARGEWFDYNQTLSLYSLPFSLTLAWDELDWYGRWLGWFEPRIILPSHPPSQKTSEHCYHSEIMWHIYFESASRNHQFNRGQDIQWFVWCSGFKVLLRSMDSWQNVRQEKIAFGTWQLTFVILKRHSHRNTLNPTGQADNVCEHLW